MLSVAQLMLSLEQSSQLWRRDSTLPVLKLGQNCHTHIQPERKLSIGSHGGAVSRVRTLSSFSNYDWWSIMSVTLINEMPLDTIDWIYSSFVITISYQIRVPNKNCYMRRHRQLSDLRCSHDFHQLAIDVKYAHLLSLKVIIQSTEWT